MFEPINPEEPNQLEEEIKMEEFIAFKLFIAETFGVSILGTKDYFDGSVEELSAALRDVQEFIGAMVTEHDKLADEVAPNMRLVGKRGRKSGDAKVITTADDVMKKLNKK